MTAVSEVKMDTSTVKSKAKAMAVNKDSFSWIPTADILLKDVFLILGKQNGKNME
jgi:hypothetical protein